MRFLERDHPAENLRLYAIELAERAFKDGRKGHLERSDYFFRQAIEITRARRELKRTNLLIRLSQAQVHILRGNPESRELAAVIIGGIEESMTNNGLNEKDQALIENLLHQAKKNYPQISPDTVANTALYTAEQWPTLHDYTPEGHTDVIEDSPLAAIDSGAQADAPADGGLGRIEPVPDIGLARA